MPRWNRFLRASFLLALLMGLLAGYGAPSLAGEPVQAAPMGAVTPGDIVISEFRTTGPSGSSDEFIELHNLTSNPITVSDLKVMGSSNSGSVSTRATIAVTLLPGQYYLLVNTGASASLRALADATYSSGISDDGGIAILDGTTIIDQVGMSSDSAYQEGTPLTALSSFTDQSYERKGSGCLDANNNSTDFILENPSSPQNIASAPVVCADLSLTMSVINPTPNLGDIVTFKIKVTNSGPGKATNISVRDVIPTAGLSYQSSVASAGTYDPLTGFWTIPVLAREATATLDINTQVTLDGVKTNRAEIWTADEFDPDSTPGNGNTTEDDYVLAKATTPGATTLNITNSVNNPNPNVGSNVVFTIIVNNPLTNPFDATNVAVAAFLPSGLNFVSYSSTVGTYNSGSGVWTIGSLTRDTSAILNVTARVVSTNPNPYTATVSSDEYLDSSATAIINNPLSGEANLSLTHDPVVVSTSIADQVGLKLKLYNAGPDTATNVQVKDLLPSGLDYVSYTSSTGTYNNTSGIWAIDSLPSGSNAILTINVKVDPKGSSTKNFAQVWLSEQYDPDSVPGNGDKSEDDDTSLEVSIADLSLVEKVDVAGSNAVFTITVTNSGPDDATRVKIKTSLPSLSPPYIFVSAGATQGTYDKDSGIWDLGSLLDGDSATLTITTTTSGSLLVNWVEVSASDQVDPDSVPNNNSKTEDDDSSAPAADLYLTQTVNNPNPDVGVNVVFTITVGNSGIAGTTNVQVKDLLPSGLTYVSDDGGGNYNSSSGLWSVGTLASGASKTLKITAKVSTNGIKTNWAEVWKSDEYDADSTPGNGSTTEDDDASAAVTSYRSIIINEVAWSGTTASAGDEWLELYNPSSASINITGWTLKSSSGSFDVTLSGTISAGGYFLLEREDNSTIIDINADQIYSGESLNLLSDSGETLTLRDSLGNFIDTANGNGGSWPAGSASGNHGTMERVGISAESDSTWVTNRGNPKNGRDVNNDFIYGTPRRANSNGSLPPPTSTPVRVPTSAQAPAVGKMIINEFLPRAGFDWNQDGVINVRDEFIEIKNLGPVDVKLNGWRLDDDANQGSAPFTIPSMTVKPGQRVVFYALQTGISLSDGGDTVRLLNSSGAVVDAFTYSIAKETDHSWCRIPDIPANGNWQDSCLPTPGNVNSLKGPIPSAPPGTGLEAPLCALPDTLLPDYFFAECNGYGAGIWRSMFWDESGWLDRLSIHDNRSKWESFVE